MRLGLTDLCKQSGAAESGHDRIDRLRCAALVRTHGDVVGEVMRMAEFVAAPSKAKGSPLNAAIAPDGFPPLQLRHGAINADAESAGAGVAKNPENFLLPFPFLEEVVDDEIRAQFDMLSPASM